MGKMVDFLKDVVELSLKKKEYFSNGTEDLSMEINKVKENFSMENM